MNSETMAAHSGPAQVQARQGPNTEGEVDRGSSSLSKRLSATDTPPPLPLLAPEELMARQGVALWESTRLTCARALGSILQNSPP